MPRNNGLWNWVVLVVTVGGYVPLVIGGLHHHSEINLAAYSLWAIAMAMAFGSAFYMKYDTWRLALGFFIGNVTMIILGLSVGGYTFNLGKSETLSLYTIVAALSIWGAIGTVTKKWNNRLLLFGAIASDVISFYPQLMQYLKPHERPTSMLLVGWTFWALGAAISFIFVEKFFTKLMMSKEEYMRTFDKPSKNIASILEESAFSFENFALITITMWVMAR
jgi:hypothetical protein